MLILLPCKVYRYREVGDKSCYEIQFVYNDIFLVKLIIKYKTSYFKAKDIAIYSISELNSTVYAPDTKIFDYEMSSYELYRQMTFAAKRVHYELVVIPSLFVTPFL